MPVIVGIALLVLWAIGVFWGGFVASTLWDWFMVPLGMVSINYWHASGLSALLSVFLGPRGMHRGDDKDDVGAELAYYLVGAVVIPLICLAAGWVAHQNM